MSLTTTFKALSDPIRRKILNILKKSPMSAGEISKQFDLCDATISHHLATLREADLISSTRKGTFLVYSLNTSIFEDVMNWFLEFDKKEDK